MPMSDDERSRLLQATMKITAAQDQLYETILAFAIAEQSRGEDWVRNFVEVALLPPSERTPDQDAMIKTLAVYGVQSFVKQHAEFRVDSPDLEAQWGGNPESES